MASLWYGSAAWGDYDGDGRLDILQAGNGLKVYHNDGGGAFTEDAGAAVTSVNNAAAAWGDYDNDGRLDILLLGMDAAYAAVAKVYRSRAGYANAVPAAPTGLNASILFADLGHAFLDGPG